MEAFGSVGEDAVGEVVAETVEAVAEVVDEVAVVLVAKYSQLSSHH